MNNTEKIKQMECEIEKLNDMIGKYEQALKIAFDEFTNYVGCNECNHSKLCENNCLLSCQTITIHDWKNKAGIETYFKQVNVKR